MEIIIDKNQEEVYKINESIALVFDEYENYLDIDNTFFPISSLIENFKKFEDYIEVTNGYEIAQIPKECLEIILKLIKSKNLTIIK